MAQVCGGYDRGECLRSVESYDPELNEWSKEAKMTEARGRFQITVLDNVVYAIGGSNGTIQIFHHMLTLCLSNANPLSHFHKNRYN